MAVSTTFALGSLPATGRVVRSPKHSFQIATKPFEIAPFMIAPVLPGETLKNLRLQSRVVTDPIKNKLVGWWKEYYFFYIKHRDLTARDDFVDMMLDLSKDLSAHKATVNGLPYYEYEGGMRWAYLCHQRVVEEYFRDEGEAWNVASISQYPAAKINYDGIAESLILDSAFDTSSEMPEDAANVSIDDFEKLRENWEFMSRMRMTNMTYEDYIRTYGVRIPTAEEQHKPELIRYVRDWTYPTNTVDPLTGTPTSAATWSVAERADKDRFFKEPGFVFGVTVTRPKVYLGNQYGAGASAMDNALLWLPALMRESPETSLKKYAAATSGDGLFQDISSAYWVDVRDLLVYGDQWLNTDLAGTASALVNLPDATGGRKYPTEADVDALFTSGTAEMVREDGVVSLDILGTQQDQT